MIRVAITFEASAWQYTINSGNNKLLESTLYRHRDNVRAAVRKLQAVTTGYNPETHEPVPSELALACADALDADAKAYKQMPNRLKSLEGWTPPERAIPAPPSPPLGAIEGQAAAVWSAPPAPAAAPESKGSEWLAPAAPKEPWS